MASKPQQIKKQQLLSELTTRRNAIATGAERIKGAVATKKAPTNKPVAVLTEKGAKSVGVVNKLKSAKGVLSKVSSNEKIQGLVKNEKVQGLLKKVKTPNKISEGAKDLPIKPLAIGLGALVVVGMISGAKKKKKKAKNANVAKMGVGLMLFKWILAILQPAVKQVVTKKVKDSFMA